MKKIVFVILLILCSISIFSQERKYSTYYYQRATLFETLNVTSDDILFIGNSITDGAEWFELFDNPKVKNRGISGDTTYGVYDRISTLLKGHPQKIFLMIGINNVPLGEDAQTIARGIYKIVNKIKLESPTTKIYLQSVLPVNPDLNMFNGHTSRWKMIPDINKAIKNIAESENIEYIDLYSHFVNNEGKLDLKYTNDGLHLLGQGYLLWKDIVKPYIANSIPNHPIPHGVSAPFAGVINDWIIVAGGCNFPDIPAAEGGKKVYYSEIYAINMKEKSKGWKLIGRLPNCAAYGATVSIGNNLYFIGGENMEGKLNSVYKVSMNSEACKVDLETLPSIPECITNLSGTAIGQDIYITGGITDTNKNSVYRISTQSSSEWEKLLSYPGNKRIQSILLANGKNELYLIGGFQSPSKKKEGVLSDDILCYNIEKRSWKRLIELPFDENGEKRCLVGGSGIAHNDMLILTGGVNYKIFNNAINGKAPNDYLKKPVEWYKFNDDILFLNLRNKTWNIVKDVNGMAKAGGILLEYKNSLYMICGETKPGIRSSEVITIPLSHIEQ